MKTLLFTQPWHFSPDGFKTVRVAPNEVAELPDDLAEKAIAKGLAKLHTKGAPAPTLTPEQLEAKAKADQEAAAQKAKEEAAAKEAKAQADAAKAAEAEAKKKAKAEATAKAAEEAARKKAEKEAAKTGAQPQA